MKADDGASAALTSFSFHDFAWRMLLERKDEFIAKDEEHKRAEEERKRAEHRSRGY